MKRKALAAIAKKLREDGSTYLSIVEQAVEEYAAKREGKAMPNNPETHSAASTKKIGSVQADSTTEEKSSLLKKSAISLLEADIPIEPIWDLSLPPSASALIGQNKD